MPATANIKAVITAEDRASATLAGFGSSVESVAKRATIAVAAIGAAAVGFGVSTVKSFMESQNAVTQLEAVLKSTNNVAGVTSKAAQDFADSMQTMTKYTDEEVLSVENMLLTFTNIHQNIFPQATTAVLDLATALGEDTKSASIQLGKALQDPILGVTALRRVGVAFTESQREQIKALVESGQLLTAQNMILKELQVEFGGSAKAAGTTFAGRLAILRNSLDEVKEGIGQLIVNAITPLATRIANFVNSDKFQLWLKQLNDWIKVNLPIAINYLTNVVWPLLKSAFDTTWPIIRTLLKWVADLISFIRDNTWVVVALGGAFVALKTAMFLTGAVQAFTAVMTAIRAQIALTSASTSGLWALISKGAIMGNIVVAGALADIALVATAVNRVLGAINAMNQAKNAAISEAESTGEVLTRLYRLLASPDQATRARAAQSLRNLGQPVYGFASGTNYAPGGPALVGERGPEIVNLPQGSKVIPNNKIGSTINVSFSGIFTSSEIEFRKLAIKVFQAASDAASMQNLDVSNMTAQNWRRI